MPNFDQLNVVISQNTPQDYLVAVVVFLVITAALKATQMIVLSRLQKLAEKTKNDFDDVIIGILRGIKKPFYIVFSLFFAAKVLLVPELLDKILDIAFAAVLMYEVIQGIQSLVDYVIQKQLDKDGETEEEKQQNQTMMHAIGIIMKVALWVIGITIVMANIGIDVTSVVASLGIGGIAIALAVQNVLGDIFSSFSIYIDKPFQIGDFIVVGEDMGTVERIGLKSTRIRTLQGEQLIMSNKELTAARVQNFKRMENRRVVINLGVTYDTPAEKLEAIPETVKKIVADIDKAEFDRCHFESYGDSSLNFEVVFYVQSADYNEYMDVRQELNLEIFREFQRREIEFAYPTQTVLLHRE